MRKLYSSGSEFESKIGYSRAVQSGDFLFISGTTGYDYSTMSISEDVAQQCEQCFQNIAKVIHEAGFQMNDIVRVSYILPNPSDFELCYGVLQKYLGTIRPAATMIGAALINQSIKIEIEVTLHKSQA